MFLEIPFWACRSIVFATLDQKSWKKLNTEPEKMQRCILTVPSVAVAWVSQNWVGVNLQRFSETNEAGLAQNGECGFRLNIIAQGKILLQ